MRVRGFFRFTSVLAVALALSAGGCGKKNHKAPAASAGSGSTAGSSAGSAAGSAGSAGSAAAAGSGSAAQLPPVLTSTTPQGAVDAADRPAEDKALDAGRRPAELITFLGIGRGMKVAEILAGGGYTTELLARVVGPEGTVFAQNTPEILQKFAEKPFSDRLARLKMPWIVRADTPLTAPLPDDAKDLDMVVANLVYHDTVGMGVDRAAMNSAIWKSLKPGGLYAIIDHTAKPGSGEQAAKDLHRIDPKFVQTEVEKAGFVLDRTSNMYANPKDTLDWNASPMAAGDKRGTSDRFVMVFRKQTGQ
ncbi:MAG TPA: SAM-dependent methyltransferase [Kofleriaceae bacterium]|nr:SAM-dependent methyltransferase [Kofleriaceae bacterium]